MTELETVLDETLRTFAPRFKSLEDDASSLAVHLKRALERAGIDSMGVGLKALAMGRGPLFERLIGIYRSHGRFGLVEVHFKVDEWGAGLPPRDMRARFHAFAAMGEGQSAVRCWQHYIRKNAQMFWLDVRDRDAAAKTLARDPSTKPEHDRQVASLQRTKRLTLETIALARRPFEAFGTPRQTDWLARITAEILAEERTRIAAKPLPDDMDEARFWHLLETGGETTTERLDTLADRLAAYGGPAIKAFGQMATDRMGAAYRADVWALAYLLMGGCSDDAFDDFRGWLLLQGREAYEAVLADPDAFDPAALAETPLAEGLMTAVEQAYTMRTGKDLPRLKQPKLKPLSLDEDAFASMLPRVAEKAA